MQRRPATIIHCLAMGLFIGLSLAAGLVLASGDYLPRPPTAARL